jgi:histidine phosphotransferase ChpT
MRNLMQNDLKMSYLMTAKICHDLAAPLGSLGMGLESLDLDETGQMLMHSYFLSNFKLRFYRLFMTSNIDGPSLFEFVPLLNEYAKNQKINLNWSKNILEAQDFKGDIARLLMGVVYLFMEPLIRGGDCFVTLTEDALTIKSSGPICPIRDTYKRILSGDDIPHDEYSGRTIFPIFLMQLAKNAHCTPYFNSSDEFIEISFK